AAIRRRVYLDDVGTRRATPDPAARLTLAAGFSVLRALAIERHRKHARESRLSNPARTAEQVAVRDATVRDRSLQRGRDMRLHDYIGKTLRSVFAGKREGHQESGIRNQESGARGEIPSTRHGRESARKMYPSRRD